MNVKKQLGLKIKTLRKNLKLSQEKFAEIIGISRHSLSELERGVNFASAETLEKIHKNFKIDYNELFSFSKKEPSRINNIILKLKMLSDKDLDYIEPILDAIINKKHQ